MLSRKRWLKARTRGGLDFSSMPTGEARQAGRGDIESLSVVSKPERPANTSRIMEGERANLKEALRQVKGNKGSAGIDQMTVDQLGDYLKQHWPAIREQLLNGTYEPKPVKRCAYCPRPSFSSQSATCCIVAPALETS